MDTLWLAIYILMWPAIRLGVLTVIWGAMWVEMRAARKEGEDVV